MKNNKVDFVIIWVNDSDDKWLKEKNSHKITTESINDIDNTEVRYRDWDNLKYWFRSVDKFAPWVNKVHFVSYNQAPEWLNTNYPKLNIVNHNDFIPNEFLPTFSSNPIELNIHRIKGLSEHFVFFNDDMFLTSQTPSDLFFDKKGLPRYRASINATVPNGNHNDTMPYIYFNDISIINRHFSKNELLRKNINKWLNWRYGLSLLSRTLLNLPYSGFTGMYFDHLPAPYLKSTFNEVWEKETKTMSETSSHKFRSDRDVNQYLIRAWQICKGEFSPLRLGSRGRAYFMPDNYKQAIKAIKNKKHNMLCINDSEDIKDFYKIKSEINSAFEELLPNKSSFEL